MSNVGESLRSAPKQRESPVSHWVQQTAKALRSDLRSAPKPRRRPPQTAESLSHRDLVPYSHRKTRLRHRRVPIVNDYVPVHMREDPDAVEQWRQLRQELTASLAGALGDWINPWLYERTGRENALSREMALLFELDSPLGVASAVRSEVCHRGPYALSCLDYVLSREFVPMDGVKDKSLAELQKILDLGRSVWMVAEDPASGGFRLERRDLAQTQELVGNIVRSTDRPGTLLAAAWKAIAGVSPSPNEAYNQAVRAIEAAYGPIVLPTNKKPRLGTIQNAIEAKPSKWRFALAVPDDDGAETHAGVETVSEMMRVLARANVRHGSQEPIQHSADEALAAVHLAVSLVGFVASGAFRTS